VASHNGHRAELAGIVLTPTARPPSYALLCLRTERSRHCRGNITSRVGSIDAALRKTTWWRIGATDLGCGRSAWHGSFPISSENRVRMTAIGRVRLQCIASLVFN